MLKTFRKLASEAPFDVVFYHPFFPFFDQFAEVCFIKNIYEFAVSNFSISIFICWLFVVGNDISSLIFTNFEFPV